MADPWVRLLLCCCLVFGAVAMSPTVGTQPLRRTQTTSMLPSSSPPTPQSPTTATPPSTTPPTTTTTTTAAPPASRDMTYWITFPTTLRSGSNLAVRACMPSATGPVTLRLDLIDYDGVNLQDGQIFILNATRDIQTVYLSISSNLTEKSLMFLRARAWGGVKKSDGFQRVKRDNKRLSIFIQTDKAIYKPGQTVRFRALAMQPDTKVADKPMDIVITDTKNNLIARWKGVKGKDSGVFQGEMVTSDYPPLGLWKIKCTVDEQTEEKTFELREYELPRFEVKLELPSYGLLTDKTFVGKVTAKYTFGSPIRGTGYVAVKYNHWRPTEFDMRKKFELDEYGEAEVTYTYNELYALVSGEYSQNRYFFTPTMDHRSFQFKAEVTDSLTDDVMTASTSLTFYKSPLKLQFSSLTPAAYKAGLLPFYAYVEASQPDGKPLVKPTSQSVNFTVQFYRKRDRATGYFYWWYPREEEMKDERLEKTVSLNSHGVAKLTVRSVPGNATRLFITAKSGDYSTVRSVYRFESPGTAFLKMEMIPKSLRVGKLVKVNLTSNVNFGDYNCQVFSKGMLVAAEKHVRRHRNQPVCSFKLTPAMAPVADVIAFFEAEGGEVVVDRLVLGVEDYSGNDVEIKFKETEVKPGQATKLTLKTKQPQSTLFLLGVDTSVKLLGTGNDITNDDILSELKAYGSKNVYRLGRFWYYQDQSRKAYDVFRDAGAGIITDGLVTGKDLNDVPKPFKEEAVPSTFPPIRFEEQMASAMAPAAPSPMVRAQAQSSPAQATPETPAEQLRKFFPETWLWEMVTMSCATHETLNVTAPDTITSWEVTAFAVNPKWGLTVAKEQAKLVTIKRLFVTLDLPYSAIRGEDVCFKALTFNRDTVSVNVSITLAQNSSAFQNILVKENAFNPGKFMEVRESVLEQKYLGLLEPNAIVGTTFCVSPETLGDMPVKVTVQSDKASDGVVRTILIKPEGVERSQSYPVLIEISCDDTFSKTVEIDLPDELVPGSLRISISLIGDVLGMVADNLEDLLQMPTGCGEQNMIHFAPNTYLIDYLRKTGRLTPAILTKSKNFMVAGYQRQLNYQHSDGSFSAFGNRDPSGSTWLTAFVVKCFVQAAALGSEVITIEPNVIINAISWLRQNQNVNGTFKEPGRVIHKEMQGGSAKGPGLAAYVTIALLEANNTFYHDMSSTHRTQLNSALKLSLDYLESQLPSVTNKTWGKKDSYTACILAYALNLAHSSKADEAISVMNDLAETADTLKFWSGPPEVKQTYYPWYKKTDALSIEMTSHALLTVKQKGDVDEAILIYRWLNQQRGPKGGFSSTQDTVLGLEALAAMSDLALGENVSPIQVTVTWNSGGAQSQSMIINKDNVMLLQKLDLPLQNDEYPDQITITATSSVPDGDSVFALAEVVAYYNVDNRTSPQVFNISTNVIDSTATSFSLKTCVSLQANATSDRDSMTVVEIGLPSGYRATKSSDFGNTEKEEFLEGKVVLYYYELDSKGECSLLKMKMNVGMVANVKPTFIKVYNYYETKDEYTTYYIPPVAEICEFKGCNSVDSHSWHRQKIK